LAFSLACSQADQEKAREREAEARHKAQQEAARAGAEARKLGSEAKQEAKDLGRNVDRALQPLPADTRRAGSEAEAKLKHGGEQLRDAGNQGAVKLDHAAMLARVKAKLASDVGLATVTSVDVDSSGHVVTLRGTVTSDAQRQQAEQAVSQVSGVTKVVDELRVQP
jgi:osmotically-inducible protein OsmY